MVKYMIHNKSHKNKPVYVSAKQFKTVQTTIDDLITAIEKGKSIRPGVLKDDGSTDKDWIQQQLIFIDVDDYSISESLNTCFLYNLQPVFIYKSFNYSEEKEKHRLVFVLDKVITNKDKIKIINSKLISIFGADSRCSNLARVFYGTNHKAMYINKNAVIDSDSVALIDNANRDAQTPHGFNFDKIDAKKQLVAKSYQQVQPFREMVQQLIYNILILRINCCTKSINGCDPVIPIDWGTFSTTNFVKIGDTLIATSYAQLKDSIKQIPLHKVLGLPENTNFSCLAHKDNNPSANIYKDSNGFYYYKCFSCGLTFDIFDVVIAAYQIKGSRAYQMQKAMDLIVENLNIQLINTKWHKSQQQMIKDNRAMLLRIQQIKDKYPNVFRKINLNQQLLNVMLNIAEYTLDRIPLAQVDNHNLLFSASYRYLGQQINRRHETIIKRLDDLMLIGFIRKLSDKELGSYNPQLLKKSKELSAKLDTNKTIQYYTLDTWTEDTLQIAEQVLIRYKELGGVKKGASYRQFDAFGIQTRVKGKKDNSEAIRQQKDILFKWAKRTIDRKSCIIKNEYLKYAKKKQISEEVATGFIIDICKLFNLKRCSISKEYIKKYSLPKNTLRKTAFIKN